MARPTLPPCPHCNGQLRPHAEDLGVLTCWQCAREFNEELRPLVAKRTERPVNWLDSQDARLIRLYSDDRLSISAIAQEMGSTYGSVASRLKRLKARGLVEHQRPVGRPRAEVR